MRTILITGGAGFIGSSIALALREARDGVDVTVLDNLRRRGSELNIERLKAAGVRFLHGDIRNPEDFEEAGPSDLVIECSAEPAVLSGYTNSPAYVLQTNLNGAIHCLEYARRHGSAFLFLSTSRVYPMDVLNQLAYTENETRLELSQEQPMPGASVRGISEAFPLEGVRSFYGATKLAGELLLQEYLAAYGLLGCVLRLSVTSGPWQMGKADQGLAALWAARHMFGRPLRYIGYGGSGKQVRDLLHINDATRLVLHAMDHLETLNGRVLNAGGGVEHSVSLVELSALCREITGNSVPITSEAETRAADVPIFITDFTRLSEATGWKPRHSPVETIEDICRWIRDNRSRLEAILE